MSEDAKVAVLEIGKNSMVQVSMGVIICIIIFSVKATNYARDITDEIRDGNRISSIQFSEVKNDIEHLKGSVDGVAKQARENAQKILDAAEEVKRKHEAN